MSFVARPDAPDSRRVHERQLVELFDEIRAAVDDLELGVLDRDSESPTHGKRPGQTALELLGRARRGTRDGYPTSSGLDPSGGTPARSCAECGGSGVRLSDGQSCDCDPGPPVHGDPVGELAAADVASDPIRRAAADVLRGVRGAVGDLRMAVRALSTAEPPAGASTKPAGCRNHALLNRWEPVYRAGLCRWCYDLALLEGADPPAGLVDAHDRGIRISDRMVAEAYEHIPTSRRGKRRARR